MSTLGTVYHGRRSPATFTQPPSAVQTEITQVVMHPMASIRQHNSSYRRPTSSHHRNASLSQSQFHPHLHSPLHRVQRPGGNLKWSRFNADRGRPPSFSTNRVWRNNQPDSRPATKNPTPSTSCTPSPIKSLVQGTPEQKQSQKVTLASGEFTRTNGGFSIVRENPTTMSSSYRESSETNAHSLLSDKSASFRANLLRKRAQVVVRRARAVKAKMNQVRTEYCLFFNRYGYCNNKNECKFIHDSRKVAVCRNFLNGNCHDTKCKLSHKPDQNKMPVCTQYLRGMCARDQCPYRHVKVSGQAGICQEFLKGFCPLGHQCRLKHELPSTNSLGKQKYTSPETTSTPAKRSCTEGKKQESEAPESKLSEPQVQLIDTKIIVSDNEVDSNGGNLTLSIRPNIRFSSKHSKGPSFLKRKWTS